MAPISTIQPIWVMLETTRYAVFNSFQHYNKLSWKVISTDTGKYYYRIFIFNRIIIFQQQCGNSGSIAFATLFLICIIYLFNDWLPVCKNWELLLWNFVVVFFNMLLQLCDRKIKVTLHRQIFDIFLKNSVKDRSKRSHIWQRSAPIRLIET